MHFPKATLPSRSRALAALLIVTLVAALAGASPQAQPPPANAAAGPSRDFFGMNLYVTGLERPKGEKVAMLNAAEDLRVQWSREEMSWANLEPHSKGLFNYEPYDFWINELVKRGIRVIGALQTTPSWASGVPQGSPDWYWYAPNNPQDFADFAAEMAAHYRGKIDVWEIWNEPDVEITFRCDCDRAERYARMLELSYTAIKRANPDATVLIGGLSIHDRNNGGMSFLDAVVAHSGGKLNFDVLSIHPYMPDREPESTDPKTVVQNFPYRLEMSYRWLQEHNAANKEIWITENGYSTCTGCGNLGVSEEEQARRLVRLHIIAMGAPGVTHFTYFQLKDKFNAGPSDLWGNMGIMRNNLSEKPAYVGYRVLTDRLLDATFTGAGPLMRPVENRWQPQFDRYHYRFSAPAGIVQVLWKLGSPEVAEVEVSEQQVELMEIDGDVRALPVANGRVRVTISEDPIFITELRPGIDNVELDAANDPASPTGLRPSKRFAAYWQQHGGLPLFGYAITPERIERNPTDGKEYVVQWFERARFEWHPEYAGTEAEVLLGLLGRQVTAGRTFPVIPPPAGVASVCTEATGHCVWGRFLERWRELGVPIVGLPISDQFEEKSTDGKTYWVQYFERARFEYHPENTPPHDVLLGLLGRQLYRR
jgi:hypothetical protein